jgi:hypothetical protein
MLNKIPFIGWMFTAIAAVGLAVPFWFFWTVCGIGATYFYFVPEVFRVIPFWDCFGLFIVILIVKGTLVPKLFSVSNTQKVGEN